MNASRISVIENSNSPGILNADRPDVSTVKQNTTDTGLVHSVERKPDVMAALQVSRYCENCSDFYA